MRALSVLGLIPRISAAPPGPWIFPPVCLRILLMCALITSSHRRLSASDTEDRSACMSVMFAVSQSKDNRSPLLRILARYVLRLKPGYFRLLSDFEIELTVGGEPIREQGRTLHELVAFQPIG